MMELPRPLAPWAPLLNIFPRDIALALGSVVQRLARAIGTFALEARATPGDPDGFDGFTRRGNYDRLLLSEWLLADEAPLEFSRRAASGEHAFIKLAQREPASARSTLALFDAGPGQFGGPRIAQIAALVILARRAESAGRGFQWGIAQSPELPLQDQVTEAGIRRFLAARTYTEFSEDHLHQWNALYDLNDAEDAWLIGGPSLSRLAGADRWSHLHIADTYEPDASRLSVTVFGKGSRKPAPAVLLDLPDDATSARLLRDPFKATPTPFLSGTEAGYPVSNLRFVGGARVVARSSDQGIIVYTFPSSPKQVPARPQPYAKNHAYPIIGAGRVRRQVIIASRYGERTIRVEGVSGSDNVLRGNYACDFHLPSIDPESLPPLGPCWPLRAEGKGASGLLLLNWEKLIYLNIEQKTASILAEEVINVLPIRDTYWYIRAFKDHGIAAGVVAPDGSMKDLTLHNDNSHNGGVFLGQPGGLYNGKSPLLAFGSHDNRWTLPVYLEETLVAPAGSTLCGVLGCRERWVTPALVVLRDDRRTLSFIGHTWSADLPRETSDIDQVALSPIGSELAYITANGELVVHSIARAENLMRLKLQEEI